MDKYQLDSLMMYEQHEINNKNKTYYTLAKSIYIYIYIYIIH